MKTAISVALLLVAVCQMTNAVFVQEGDFTFSLESVRTLGNLLGSEEGAEKQNPRLMKTSTVAVCGHPSLPVEFLPLCQSGEAGVSLDRLAFVAAHADACEICSYAACTGC